MTTFDGTAPDRNPISDDTRRHVQRQAHALLQAHITSMVTLLGQIQPRQSGPASGNAIDVRQLTSASRQHTAATQTRRKMARDILVAALLNRNNPDWNMTDASTYLDGADDPLVALMRQVPLR